MQKKKWMKIVVFVTAIFLCLVQFSGCEDPSHEQRLSKLDQIEKKMKVSDDQVVDLVDALLTDKATLEKVKTELGLTDEDVVEVVKALLASNEDRGSIIESVKEKLEISEVDYSDTESLIKAINNKIADLEAKIAEKDQEIENLNKEKDSLTATIDEIKEKLGITDKDVVAEVSSLLKEKEDLNSVVEAIKDKLNLKEEDSDVVEELVKLIEEKVQLEAKIAELEGLLNESEQRLSKLDQIEEKLKVTDNQVVELVEALLTDKETLEKVKTELKLTDGDVVEVVKALIASNDDRGEIIDDVKEKLKGISGEDFDDTDSLIDAINKKIADLEAQIAELEGRQYVSRTTTTKTVVVKADTVSYNLDDAVALATTWGKDVPAARFARAISPVETETSDTLLKISEDGEVGSVIVVNSLSDSEIEALDSSELTEEDLNGYDSEIADVETSTEVILLEEGQSVDDVETDVTEIKVEVVELKDGFELPPVRQVYQCPSIDIDDDQKGIYISYASYKGWSYTDETPANFGSLVYVKPNGSTNDIFAKYGNYKLVPAYGMKSSDDEEFLQFDASGHMFVAAYDEMGKISIYRYEPIGGILTKVLPEISGLQVRNYKVSTDGKWLFLNAMVDKANHVYAVPTFRPEEYITLYASSAEEYSVENVVVTNDKTVYFFVNDYAGGRRTSGLYKCKFDYAGNTYSESNIEKEITLPYWAFQEDLKNDYTKEDGSIDYDGLLNFIYSFCDSSSEKEFRLDKAFAEYSEEEGTYDWCFGKLYTKLKNKEALEFIFENEERTGLFAYYCYIEDRKDDGTYKGGNGRFPFERFVFVKDKNETAYKVSPAYYNTDFGSTDTTGGILLKNNEGVFVLKPSNWNDSEGVKWFDCSKVVKVVDNNGNYVFETPDSLKHFECPAPRKDYVYVDPTQKDWYKKPFQTNSDGIFVYDKTETQVWYYSNGVALNLLANDDAAIDKINSFYADDDSITFNASCNNSTFTHKIDIESRSLYSYKLSGDLTQIIEVNNAPFEAAKNNGYAGISIKFVDIADLHVKISKKSADGKIILTADKTYNEEGFEENFSSYKWTCLGKVLNTEDDGSVKTGAYSLEIDTTKYVPGSYPILVTAKKADGTICSCFFNLIIE